MVPADLAAVFFAGAAGASTTGAAAGAFFSCDARRRPRRSSCRFKVSRRYLPVQLSVFNATDELYPVMGNSSMTTASGYAEIIYARPRNITLSFEKKF